MKQEPKEHRWSTLRDQACELFGEQPGAQLEQDIIDQFIDDPERVARAIHRIATASGSIGSRWAVLRADLRRSSQADVVANATAGRAKAVDRAKQWIANAGIHLDRQADIEAELFGDDYTRGRLDAHRHDDKLRADLIAYWQEQRPRGIAAEQAHLEWAEKCKTDRAIVLEQRRKERACSTDSASGEPTDASTEFSTASSVQPTSERSSAATSGSHPNGQSTTSRAATPIAPNTDINQAAKRASASTDPANDPIPEFA